MFPDLLELRTKPPFSSSLMVANLITYTLGNLLANINCPSRIVMYVYLVYGQFVLVFSVQWFYLYIYLF